MTTGLDCPCGLTGVNCTELVAPLVDASLAANDTCSPEGFGFCAIGAEFAQCFCQAGYKGAFCQTKIEAKVYNFYIGFIFSFTLLFIECL